MIVHPQPIAYDAQTNTWRTDWLTRYDLTDEQRRQLLRAPHAGVVIDAPAHLGDPVTVHPGNVRAPRFGGGSDDWWTWLRNGDPGDTVHMAPDGTAYRVPRPQHSGNYYTTGVETDESYARYRAANPPRQPPSS